MEVANTERASRVSREGLTSCVVLGPWSNQPPSAAAAAVAEAEEEGLECRHCDFVSEATSSQHQKESDIAANDSKNKTTSSIDKSQKRQIMTVPQLFSFLQHEIKKPSEAIESTKRRSVFRKNKKFCRDSASVASTVAETLDSSINSVHRNEHVFTDTVPRTIVIVVPNDDNNDSEANIPLIQSRLFETGVVQSMDEFEFVVDRVSKEVAENFTDKESNLDEDNNTAHVKTGVWQVTCFDNDRGKAQPPFYIVTGVSMNDRVDTKKLRKVVLAGQTHKRRPKLSLAPTKIAEELTGYKSGTMAPICHTTNMKLFLEERLLQSQCDASSHKLNMGSGMFGKCLSISADKFLQIAKRNPKGMEICSIVRKK